MLKDATERYLIMKMAELAEKYQEPYDYMDQKAFAYNDALNVEYEIYKTMLKEMNLF